MRKTANTPVPPPPNPGSGRPLLGRPSGPGMAFANFLIDFLPHLGMTNEQVAKSLGYARPTIVSMWKTGRTKVTLDALWPLSQLLKVDLGYLLALYFEQYVANSGGGVDHYAEIAALADRIVTEDEMALVQLVREARRGNSLLLTRTQAAAVKRLFKVPITTPHGPYTALPKINPGKVAPGDRTRFARRGQRLDMNVTEEDELANLRAARTRSAGKGSAVRKKAR